MSNKDIGGWLRRKGQRIHTWSRRWFVLHEKSLMMYSKEGDGKCLDTVHLKYQMISEPPLDPLDPRKGYFDITNGNEIISLLAESWEEKQAWLRALKRALYAHKGGALFSQTLEEIMFWEKVSGRHVPYIVDECVQYLYKYGLDVEGIFRLGGRLATIKEVISRFERGEKVEFEKEETDIHVVAAILKAFLRDLPDSIIPCEFYQKFMNIALRFMEAKGEDEKTGCASELADALALIPDDNYIILKYICNFLKKVSDHVDLNKMTMMNIATVFGTNIIRHIDKDNSQLILCTAGLGQNLVFMLLNYLPQVFVKEFKEDELHSNNTVATADLLHISDNASNVNTSKKGSPAPLCLDLKGLDLSPTASSPASPGTPNRSIHIVDNFFSAPKDVTGETDQLEMRKAPPRRAYHLSLKRPPVGKGDTSSLPKNSNLEPPVPPRRHKLLRNRPVSERARPKGVVISQNSRDSSLSPKSTRKSDFFTPPETPTDPVDFVTKMNEESCDTDPFFISSSTNEAQLHRSSHRDGQSSLSNEELLEENVKLKESVSLLKERYKKDLSALRSQHAVLNQKYDHRIKTMEAAYASQKATFEANLETERNNLAAAVNGMTELKRQLLEYQLQFGDLPTT